LIGWLHDSTNNLIVSPTLSTRDSLKCFCLKLPKRAQRLTSGCAQPRSLITFDDPTVLPEVNSGLLSHQNRMDELFGPDSELMKLIVERVYIDGEEVVAMTLRSNYHLVLGHNANGPTEFTADPF
jgi:hypothetical protein